MRRVIAVVLLSVLPAMTVVAGAHGEPGGPGLPGPPTWSQVSAGKSHACGVKGDHTLWCWGAQGSGGKLGTGDGLDHPSPAQVAPSIAWSSVSAGESHTCALTTAQRLYCWGANSYGGLGIGSTVDQPTPRSLGRTTWSSVTASNGSGAFATCAVTTSPALFCWGENSHGQLGDGGWTDRLSPTQVLGPTWAQAGVGASHSCALRGDGTLWCWGYRANNRIGDGGGISPAIQYVPKEVASSGAWSQLDVDHQHSCAIRASGSMYCWGRPLDNTDTIPVFGPGVGSDGFLTLVGQPYECGQWSCPLRDWTGLGVGGFHQCGIAEGGGLWCWGVDGKGQLGNGASGATSTPQRIGAAAWKQVSGGHEFTCAIKAAGHLYCWGDGSNGQLGVGDTGNRATPTFVS